MRPINLLQCKKTSSRLKYGGLGLYNSPTEKIQTHVIRHKILQLNMTIALPFSVFLAAQVIQLRLDSIKTHVELVDPIHLRAYRMDGWLGKLTRI
jgi:hypothetical protein